MGHSIYDQRLTEMIDRVAVEIKKYSLGFISHIKKLSEIGIALSAERNIEKILEMIVEEAKQFTNADAGTLYLLKDQNLHFEILYNDTMGVRLGGTTGKPITLPPVPMNKHSLSGYVATTGEIINVPDAYADTTYDFTGPKKYDEQTGYHSESFLVVPMRDHENEVIGVLQLINAKDRDTSEVIPFSPEYEDIIFSLASQAAVAITNVRLIHNIESLLGSFVRVMAAAIDERSPYNKNHTERVAYYTVALAKKMNEISFGKYKDCYFTEDELAELNMAAWLHDVGKVTTPEYIMDKPTKLSGIIDGIAIIETRLQCFIAESEIKCLKKMITKEVFAEEKQKLSDYKDFMHAINIPAEYLDDQKLARLTAIHTERFTDSSGTEKELITADEYEKLSIRKGSLTDKERDIMQNHVIVTEKLLSKMPFIKKYKQTPGIAAGHHEKINGLGYPKGLKADEIPLGARIMAIADIFDALTAQDRPYKKAMNPEQAMKILEKAAAGGEIDKDLLAIFRDYKVYEIIGKIKEEFVDER